MTAIHVPSDMATTPAIFHVHQHTPNGKQWILLSVPSDGVGVLRHIEDEIRKQARKLWLETGNPDAFANWIAAERELYGEAVQREQNVVFTALYSQKKLTALKTQLDVAQSKKAHISEMLQMVDKEIADLNDQIAQHDTENPVRDLDKNLQTPEKPFTDRKNLDTNLQTPEKSFTDHNNLDTNLQTPEKTFSNHQNQVPPLDLNFQTPEKRVIRRTKVQLVELDFHKEKEEAFKNSLFNDHAGVFQKDFAKLLQVFNTAPVVKGIHEYVCDQDRRGLISDHNGGGSTPM